MSKRLGSLQNGPWQFRSLASSLRSQPAPSTSEGTCDRVDRTAVHWFPADTGPGVIPSTQLQPASSAHGLPGVQGMQGGLNRYCDVELACSPAERSRRLARRRDRYALARSQETDDVRAVRLQREAARQAAAREEETSEARAARLQQGREREAAARAQETPEAHAARLQQGRARVAAARAQETPEARAARVEQDRACVAAARAEETPEARAARVEQDRARVAAARAEETPEALTIRRARDAAQHAAARQQRVRDEDAAESSSSDSSASDDDDDDTAEGALLKHFYASARLRPGAWQDMTWPAALAGIPNGRQQDLPAGAHVPQVPYAAHIASAARLHDTMSAYMPDRVCGVCSRMCSKAEASYMLWDDVPNSELLRADVSRNNVVRRPAHVVHWRRTLKLPNGSVPAPPDPVLVYKYRLPPLRPQQRQPAPDAPSGLRNARPAPERAAPAAAEQRPAHQSGAYGFADSDGDPADVHMADTAAASQGVVESEDASDDDRMSEDVQDYVRDADAGNLIEPEEDPMQGQRAELYPYPPREDRLPRQCLDDPATMLVAYCLRYETTGPNRTVDVCPDLQAERLCVCTDCAKALAGERVGRLPHV